MLRPVSTRTFLPPAARSFFSSVPPTEASVNDTKSTAIKEEASDAEPVAASNNDNGNNNGNGDGNRSENSSEAMTELEKKLEKTALELKELKDSYLRSLAASENLRTRTKREKELAQSLAIKKFALDILGVNDVLQLALQSVPASHRHGQIPESSDQKEQTGETVMGKEMRDLVEGLSMTLKEMDKVCSRHGLEVYDPLDEKFDPEAHEALYTVENTKLDVDGKPLSGMVVDVLKKGWRLNGVVIRAAQVGVSK